MLFRGNAEATIRTRLLKQGFIKGIIGLPANLFYGTGIPACIVILDKENAQARTGVFMIDASKGFMKDGNKNRLRSQDIHKIVDTFNKQIEIPRYSRMVAMTEIADPRRIQPQHPAPIDSRSATHARRHRTRSTAEWLLGRLPAPQPALRPTDPATAHDRRKRGQQAILVDRVPEARRRGQGAHRRLPAAHRATLAAIDENTIPNDCRHQRRPARALQAGAWRWYDVYEQLMTIGDTMHDDLFLIMNDGWLDAAKPANHRG